MNISFRPSKYNSAFVQNEFAPTLRICCQAFFILTALFTAFAFVKPDYFLSFAENLSALLENNFDTVELDRSFDTFSLIFSGNLQAAAATAIYGFFPFIYLPASALGINAFTLVSAGAYFLRSGNTLPAYLAGILPHGIFEIPALLYACAIGICHCKLIVCAILHREQPAPWREQIVSLSMVFVSIVVPLFLIAALIETFVTPSLLALFV